MGERVDPVMCPVCAHKETMRARWYERERVADDWALMHWVPPFRPRGACGNPGMPSRWDQGLWECASCGVRLTPEEAGILIDAALMHIDPHCDSIEEGPESMHSDARRALRGGVQHG